METSDVLGLTISPVLCNASIKYILYTGFYTPGPNYRPNSSYAGRGPKVSFGIARTHTYTDRPGKLQLYIPNSSHARRGYIPNSSHTGDGPKIFLEPRIIPIVQVSYTGTCLPNSSHARRGFKPNSSYAGRDPKVSFGIAKTHAYTDR